MKELSRDNVVGAPTTRAKKNCLCSSETDHESGENDEYTYKS